MVSQTDEIENCLHDIIAETLVSATFSSPNTQGTGEISKISIRPVVIKSQTLYQASEHTANKVRHRNLSMEEYKDYIRTSLFNFRQAVFTTTVASYHVLTNKKGKTTVLKKSQQALPVHSHNREKKYLLPEGAPIPFLVRLGIMTSEGKVLAKKYDKFRQINRFLEMVHTIVEHFPTDRSALKVIDFGCGKAYLTFALYYYLRYVEQRQVDMVGLDLKPEVINQCQELAKDLECEGLSFVLGDINHYESSRLEANIDLVVCLHACDTATDAALEKAVKWNTRTILCVPCCQHELYSQIECDLLSPLLRHGILRERFAALATDAARAELLTMAGYDVGIMEFIDMEHTPKNLLLRAIKTTSPKKRLLAEERYLPFKQFLHIDPSLDKRLNTL